MRARMVKILVRWGGEAPERLAYKDDDEIRSMVDRLKMHTEVGDSDFPVRIVGGAGMSSMFSAG